MPTTAESPQLNILHVLTLNGRNGEYGGPVRVARELCQELNSRGHKTHIFSGALLGSEPTSNTELSESFIYVKPITRKLKVSSLWSWKLVPPLKKLISSSDLVHIHFARDLVPFLAAFLAIILHKPFITQTHGMIISDGRLSTRLIDWLLTRPLINRSSMNLVLSDYEADAVSKLRIRPPLSIVPNGIAQSLGSVKSRNSIKRIVFCSRLDKRKGVNKFIDIAEQFKESDLSFEIYGPDGGELNFVKSEIKRKNISNTLKYKGSLPSNEVQNMLQGVDLLILPSKDEPFPMVILESLAVGTQVLVMPSCGFAGQLRDFEDAFVAESEDQKGILNSFQKFFDSGFELKSREAIRAFCGDTFGISSVTDQLVLNYKKALFNE
jgi:glycosyltransferase involved in cell wall biosynthesis